MEKQLVKIGTQFKGGKVVGIFKAGVVTINGTFQRFHPKETVDKELVKAGSR